MARIAGVNLPSKKLKISLTYIFGIGNTKALEICKKAGVDPEKRVPTLLDDEVRQLREVIDLEYDVEGKLRSEIARNIKELKDLKCYRGIRHIRKLPVRGQRTHTNARTRKGKAIPIAGKKMVTK